MKVRILPEPPISNLKLNIMRNTFTIPEKLMDKIGTEAGGFIITSVAPAGKRWKVWGIKNYTPTEKDIADWKAALVKHSKGEFGFAPGEPIGYFKTIKS
jgi:hypothetical protein